MRHGKRRIALQRPTPNLRRRRPKQSRRARHLRQFWRRRGKMDEKLKILLTNWEATQADLRQAEAALRKADSDYIEATEANNGRAMQAAAERRHTAAQALHAARMNEAVARRCAGDPNPDAAVGD